MRRIVVAIVLAALVALAAAGTAWAKPITFTKLTRFPEETIADESTRCQTEIYATTFSKGMEVVHFTYFSDTGAWHLHLVSHGKIVAVPLDGTGPGYTGHFRTSDSTNVRSIKRGELVVLDTDLDRFVARGSEESRAFFKFHAHFTYNANGVQTLVFDTTRLVCT
jgi:hypothetical protein